MLTPGPGVTTVRWLDVTIEVPDDSGVHAFGDALGPPPGGSLLQIWLPAQGHGAVALDGYTGKIALDERDTVPKELLPVVEAILSTVRVIPFDPSTPAWPYNGSPYKLEQRSVGGLNYFVPEPSTGLVVVQGCEGSCGIDLVNGRSYIALAERDGRLSVSGMESVAPEDKEAFQRFLESATVVESTFEPVP
jgi:hypothetical protein